MTIYHLVTTGRASFSRVLHVSAIIVAAAMELSLVAPNSVHADWRKRSHDAIELKLLGRYSSNIFGPDAAGAESLAHDPRTQRLFVVNVANRAIDVIDIKNPK